jgi:hypothetical protein
MTQEQLAEKTGTRKALFPAANLDYHTVVGRIKAFSKIEVHLTSLIPELQILSI